MTIKQQGGIFGRHPKFDTVEANLVGIGTDNPQAEIEIVSASPEIRLVDNSGPNSTGKITYIDSRLVIQSDDLNETGSSTIEFQVDNVEVARFNSSGNLAFPSGKGIDFSATSGTGTSELFDDYEEGTFTATLEGTASPTPKVTTTGYYTKIGRVVQFEIAFEAVDTTGYSGNVSVSGLPFTAARRTPQSILAYNSVNWTGTPVPLTAPGSTLLSVFSIDSGNVWTWATHDAGASRYINIAGSYTAA